MSKLVFVAHPVSDDPTHNAILGLMMLRKLMDAHPDVSFVAPWIEYVLTLNELNPEHRKRGCRDDMVVIERCDELWLLGSHVSRGMRAEADFARSKSIPVKDLTIESMEATQ